MSTLNISQYRQREFDVDPQFLNRWSPRAMSGETIAQQELMSLFEAAKWAPSCYNDQPWYFLYAQRTTPEWPLYFDLLVEFNQQWCKNAAVLVVIISKKNFDHNGQFNRNHSFDAGSAWFSLALQGSLMGLVVHGMGGFDPEKARKVLNIPEDYQVEAMAAIGRPGPIEALPESLRQREIPAGRKALSEIIIEGKWKA